MALNKNHQQHLDTMNAFDTADRNTPRDQLGRASYGMGAKGLPRTPAQQASVKKAAQASATARGARAAPTAPVGAPAKATPTANFGLPGKVKGGLLKA